MSKFKKLNEFIQENILICFLIIPIIFVLLFNYLPMFGIVIAFEDYNIFAGNNPFHAMLVSEWVGFDNFTKIFSTPKFIQVLQNTIVISGLKIVFLFPLPIILAICLNEIKNAKFMKTVQTIIYMPHFLSWVIVGGIWLSLLGGEGMINTILLNLNLVTEPVSFMTNNILFRFVILLSDAWKEIGWSTIIYLSAITAIDFQLYEAIRIDGGNKWREIIHVTIPGLMSTIIMLLILRMASIMDAGFDQIFNMYSVYVYDLNDILSTYIYRIGISGGEYSVATAMGLFNSVIGCALILIANKLARKYSGKSIW
ncbi:MAG: ABC transporter permease [Mycoplasmatales bacterium]